MVSRSSASVEFLDLVTIRPAFHPEYGQEIDPDDAQTTSYPIFRIAKASWPVPDGKLDNTRTLHGQE